ncbi:MAG: prepilin-type N-terminal cleavage/methylation domain-containing protein [bacterium]
MFIYRSRMQKKSFTLIEMLIVVVIIGILAAALIPRLQSVQARARDIKRIADIHQI